MPDVITVYKKSEKNFILFFLKKGLAGGGQKGSFTKNFFLEKMKIGSSKNSTYPVIYTFGTGEEPRRACRAHIMSSI